MSMATAEERTQAPTTEALIIRGGRPEDRAALHQLVAAVGVFSDEEVTCARELIDEGLDAEAANSAEGYKLLVAELATDGSVVGYVCYGRVPFTASTWDLYWLATHPAQRRLGVARSLCATMEQIIRDGGGTHVRVETSGLSGYGAARIFYERVGYSLAARLPDFYKAGDDQFLFFKRL